MLEDNKILDMFDRIKLHQYKKLRVRCNLYCLEQSIRITFGFVYYLPHREACSSFATKSCKLFHEKRNLGEFALLAIL